MPAEGGYLLAIDVGTTTTRCILFDLKGRPVGEAYREPRVYHPQTTWTEVDPEDWWACAAAAIRDALAQAGVPSEKILGVGLCGLKHALVPIDAGGRPLARAMLWMDQRCQPQAEWLAREHGDLIKEIAGRATISTTPSAPKLRWIVENEPHLLQQTDKFLLVKDFIRFRLTGTVATDPTDAGGTRLYDPRSGDWAYRLLERIGVPPEKMPPIQDSTTVAGGITTEAAQATGLAAGTPVVVGAGDVRCTLVGADALDSRRACLYLGTAAWISVARPGATHRPLSADYFGATATTGAALKWLLALLDGERRDSLSASYITLLQEAERAPPGARGLIFLPHLMGERGPQDDPAAKGTLFGLTLTHNRSDVARAVLEGCAFQVRRIAETLAFSRGKEENSADPMVVVGGGARSRLWLTIIADVTGHPLLVPRVLEAGALGASIHAGVGVGVYPSLQEAARELVQITDRIEPDAARHEQYGRIYSLYLELEDRVAPLYGRIAPAITKES